MLAKKPPPSGAPAWALTYGDMMSLLLCFFILLAAFAHYEATGGGQDAVMAAIQSIREALGMPAQAGKLGDPSMDFSSLLLKLESIIKPAGDRGDSKEEGLSGKSFRLRRIRDGMEITIGGPILFEPFSARISDEGKQALGQIGDALRGHRNKIEIGGHAAEQPCPQDWTYDDAINLSFERTRAVQNELILRGVDSRTIRLIAAGPNEPIARNVYDFAQQQHNRRVEIIVRESVIDDYAGRTPSPNPPATQPTSQPAFQAW